jgi:uncharacterized protein (PEP-CTERM system associated)
LTADRRRPRRAGLVFCLLSSGILLGPGATSAQTFHATAAIGARAIFTDNVNLAPADQATSDLAFHITPSVTFDGRTGRTQLNGRISAPATIYTRDGADNTVRVEGNVAAQYEAITNFMFVDATANVYRTYLSPFGAQPIDLAERAGNTYTAQTYSITPRIEGEASGNVKYLIKDQNIWNRLGDVGAGTRDSYSNLLDARISREIGLTEWQAEYQRDDVKFSDLQNLVTEVFRGRVRYQVTDQWRVFVTGGYEQVQGRIGETSNSIYGGGFEWRPTNRTRVSGFAEHRYFGTSYAATIQHRAARSVWSLKAGRGASTYPQLIANLPAEADVASLLDQLFRTRITDPVERRTAVDQFIAERDLPTVLSSAVPIYSERIQIVEHVTGSVALIGVRNNVTINVYRSRNQAFRPIALPAVTEVSDTIQTGATVDWRRPLAPLLVMGAQLGASQAEANDGGGAKTKQWHARIGLTRKVGPSTQVFAIAQHQTFESDVTNDYRENAVVIGFTHVFD